MKCLVLCKSTCWTCPVLTTTALLGTAGTGTGTCRTVAQADGAASAMPVQAALPVACDSDVCPARPGAGAEECEARWRCSGNSAALVLLLLLIPLQAMRHLQVAPLLRPLSLSATASHSSASRLAFASAAPLRLRSLALAPASALRCAFSSTAFSESIHASPGVLLSSEASLRVAAVVEPDERPRHCLLSCDSDDYTPHLLQLPVPVHARWNNPGERR